MTIAELLQFFCNCFIREAVIYDRSVNLMMAADDIRIRSEECHLLLLCVLLQQGEHFFTERFIRVVHRRAPWNIGI